MPLLLLSAGCIDLDTLIEDATTDEFAVVTILGVSASTNMDLSGTRYADGSQAGALLATMSGASVDGPVALSSPANGAVPLTDRGDGAWGGPGFVYAPGEEFTLVVDGTQVLWATASPAAETNLPPAQPAGTDLVVDLGAQDFDRVLVTVIELETGAEVWDNIPEDLSAAGDGLSDTDPLRVVVPGEALAELGRYAVGVVGLRSNDPADADGVNPLLSMMTTGLLVFQTVEVTD